MLSASARSAAPAPLRFRPELPSGWLLSAGMALLLVYAIAGSAVAGGWVPGSRAILPVAMSAAVLMGGLALVRRLPWPVPLAAGLLAAPLAAYAASARVIAAAHPGDPGPSLALARLWAARVADGQAVTDTAFFLYLMCLLFWIVGAWLAWCVLRWRQPLLGLVPGAAAFATTLLNYPSDQNGYMLAFLVLTLALLLWSHYHRSVEDVRRRHVRVTGDAGWDFWESGVSVMAAVVAIGIFAPPLTTADRSVDIENGVFRSWAELQQRLNHPVAFGRGEATGTSIGFNGDVQLGGPIRKTGGIVMTYSLEGTFNAPRYFRGINDVRTLRGEWRNVTDAGDPAGQRVPVGKDQPPPYAETYSAMASSSLKVSMLKPPKHYEDVIFYPGQLQKLDRSALAGESGGGSSGGGTGSLLTVDRLSGAGRAGGTGQYKLTVAYSAATEQQLREAAEEYPAWLDVYRNFAGASRPAGGTDAPPPLARGGAYRSPATLQRIRDLALRVTAGHTGEYDQVQAIEAYLRSNYTYTLTPNTPPSGTDPVDYFLFTSKEGYCEYFATAMGDLVRSLGIPVRLVNGYGPGAFDDHLKTYVVREADAHTWVEVYVPRFGWIQFEPTPDGTYFPILRGTPTGSCAPDAEFCDATGNGDSPDGKSSGKTDRVGPELDPGGSGSGLGGPLSLPQLALWAVPWLAGLLALGAAAWVAVSRWLRPRTAGSAWRRAELLARLGGLRRRPGETPHEYGLRLGEEDPELRGPAGRLAEAFAVVAYARPEVARAAQEPVLEAFADLRPLLLRRIRARGRFASATAVRA